MSFMRNQRSTPSQQPQQARPERAIGGPIVTVEDATNVGKPKVQASGFARRLPVPRSRLESIAYWVIGLAVVVLALLFVVPSLFSAITTGFYTSLFVGVLTLSNLRKPSGWANTVLGRKVFPVISSSDSEIWKLAVVNAMLVFIFAFSFNLLALYLTPFFAGMIVFGGLIALGIFYSRARRVISGPN